MSRARRRARPSSPWFSMSGRCSWRGPWTPRLGLFARNIYILSVPSGPEAESLFRRDEDRQAIRSRRSGRPPKIAGFERRNSRRSKGRTAGCTATVEPRNSNVKRLDAAAGVAPATAKSQIKALDGGRSHGSVPIASCDRIALGIYLNQMGIKRCTNPADCGKRLVRSGEASLIGEGRE